MQRPAGRRGGAGAAGDRAARGRRGRPAGRRARAAPVRAGWSGAIGVACASATALAAFARRPVTLSPFSDGSASPESRIAAFSCGVVSGAPPRARAPRRRRRWRRRSRCPRWSTRCAGSLAGQRGRHHDPCRARTGRRCARRRSRSRPGRQARSTRRRRAGWSRLVAGVGRDGVVVGSVAVAGGDDEQRAGVARDRLLDRRRGARAVERGVDDRDAELAGVVEGGGDRGRVAGTPRRRMPAARARARRGRHRSCRRPLSCAAITPAIFVPCPSSRRTVLRVAASRSCVSA